VERSQVRVSHSLANLVRLQNRTVIRLGSRPEVVLKDLDHDRLVTPLLNKVPLLPKKKKT
jgi:hypothetical protein